jgi:ribosomal protein S18 acetylase RimI-like enzyme
MVRIREAKTEHFDQLITCQLKVLESLSPSLPGEFIEEKRKRYIETDGFRPEDLQHNGQLNLVSSIDDMIVGFALGRIDRGGTSWLIFLGVLPLFRGKGVGGALLKEFIRKSKLRAAKRVSLFTAVELKPALNLYVRNGFTNDGVPRYRNYGVNLYRYEKNLV